MSIQQESQCTAEKILREYAAFFQTEEFPITFEISSNLPCSFVTSFEKGKIKLKAKSPLELAQGASQIAIAYQSGHLGDFMGGISPRFPLRPLWLKPDIFVKVTNHEGIFVPSCLLEKLDATCQRVIELGYSAISLGHFKKIPEGVPEIEADFISICHGIKSYGLITVGHPYLKSENLAFSSNFSDLDVIFWESAFETHRFFSKNFIKESTALEKAAAEIRKIEESLNPYQSLIYYLSSKGINSAKKQSPWFGRLCDEVGPRTTLSFSSLIDGMPHPFWDLLRCYFDISETPFLPILETDDPLECINWCQRHRFAGLMNFAEQIPELGTSLHAAYWVKAQMMWRNFPRTLLEQTWKKSFRN